jgi:CBS domain-containing protein
MSFYIVAKGKLTQFQFQYLEDNVPPHVEPTLLYGEKPKPKAHSTSDSKVDVYAIDVMTKNIHTLSPAATILQAKRFMELKKVHHVPLLIDHKLCGMISQRDIPENPDVFDREIRLDKVMAKLIVCASEYTPLRHVAEVFLKENINSMPIINDEFRLSGIVTHRDLIRWLLENEKFQK